MQSHRASHFPRRARAFCAAQALVVLLPSVAVAFLGWLTPGCAGAQPSRDEKAAALAADEERVRRAAEEWLRALFPEIGEQSEITRAALTHALLGAAPVEPPPDSPREAEVPLAAIAAIRRGDYATARGLLGELVARNEVQKARELLAAGDLRGALAVLDRAVATAPDSSELRSMRGEASLAVAAESGDAEFAQNALADFEEAVRKRGGPRALLGASRASRALGQGDKALEYARAGLAALDGADMALATAQGPMHAERVWAEASLDAWARGPKDADLAAREPIAALQASIGRAPEDAWAWQQLARVAFESGDAAASRRTAARGLLFFPADADLHASLARALTRLGGPDAVVAEYERFLARNPGAAIAWRELAEARYQSALGALAAGPGDAAAFARAEQDFARCRTTSQALAAECRAREALCRAGAGFARLAAGDLEGARAAFMSVEDAFKGGLALSEPPRLRAGIEGLDELANLHEAASKRATGAGASVEALERAARIHDYLHEYAPAEARYAIAAAQENRDAAVAIEIEARTLASQGKVDEANRRLVHARELMEKSHTAYTDAVALAPDDVRVAEEAGAVLVLYLQRDAETARGWLEKAARLGEARRDALRAEQAGAGLDAAQRKARAKELEAVESALGDAYQDLGVLFLMLEGNPARAREWLKKSLATSPDPREEVIGKGGLLERCEDAIQHGTDTRVRPEARWAAPIAAPK